MTCERARRRLGCAVAIPLLLATAVAGCAEGDDAGTPATLRDAVRVEFDPGLSLDLYLPDDTRRAPLVVLVPGGSWATADPAGFAGLASALADAGITAAPTRIRAAEDDVLYPVPVDDVLCAVAAAAAESRTRGVNPSRVAVLGHSSGAHLAALAVLTYADHDPDCGSPLVEPDALVGLSGPYDIAEVPDLAAALLGGPPEEDPAAWAAANPVQRATLRPDVPVLLMHGEADEVLPTDFTTRFGEALESAGHPTTVTLVADADHLGIFAPEVAAEPIATWLESLPAGR